MLIKGTVSVTVDEVAFEQIAITHPDAVENMPPAVQAMIAARHSEDFKRIKNLCADFSHTIEFNSAKQIGNYWLVTFEIRLKIAGEL